MGKEITLEQRNWFSRAVNTRAIQVAIYQVGACFAFLWWADIAAREWPPYDNLLPFIAAGLIALGLAGKAWKNWWEIKDMEKYLKSQPL